MWYVIAVVAGLVVGFSIGFVVCGALASGKCSDCRLKELKEFEDGKDKDFIDVDKYYFFIERNDFGRPRWDAQRNTKNLGDEPVGLFMFQYCGFFSKQELKKFLTKELKELFESEEYKKAKEELFRKRANGESE